MTPASGTEQTQQQRDGEAGRAEQQGGQHRHEREVRRRGGGAAGGDRVPGVQVARPQLGGVGRGGQQGAARERAAAEEFAAGDQGDHQQHQEEHRAGLARDALEPGELLDLQEVGVVAAGARLDGTAVPSGAGGDLGVGAAHEIARELLDGHADGRSRRWEQRPQLFLVDLGGASAAPPGEDPLGPEQGAQEAADLVDGLPGDLADEVGDGPQQCAEHDPQQHPGQHGRTRVDEEGVDGAGLVDFVRGGGRAAHAVDRAALAGGRLGVPDDGLGGDQDAVARRVRAPAQVDVVAHEGQVAVEAAELFEDIAADQHAGGGHRQHGPDVVVLALVLLAAVQAGPAAAGVGDADADLQQLPPVVPAAELGADDGHVLAAQLVLVVHDAQQLGQGVGLRGTVVVQQPQPLDRLSVRELGQVVRVVAPGAGDRVPAAGPLQIRQLLGSEDRGGAAALLDGLAEAGAAGEVQHAVGAEGVGDQLGGVVRAAGVGAHRVLDGSLLAEQPGERVGQPAGAVVGDEDRGHHMTRELRCGSAVVMSCRVAVHGHRGTGPGSVDCGGRLRPVGAAGRLGRATTLSAAQQGGPPPVDNPPATGRSNRTY
ncbi:hypothetical protein QF034_003133 [Streptomyces africanus]|uniref:Uncharacterized protein n=1 Tax=Streptomyces africanus TaxID=231024 RepID=A0ABU0QR67_9ACTN|nr:hypothetical protein [Streptomyces africanus]